MCVCVYDVGGPDADFSPLTQRSEEDGGGHQEAEHQSHHDDAGHDRAEAPPAHHQDDPAQHADHRRHTQTDSRERKKARRE